jgi:hypothetical protein
MHDLQRLEIREGTGKPAFAPDGSLVPPVAVQTAAWLVPIGDALYTWINGPNGRETTQLRLSPDRQIEPLPKLGVLTGGVVYCQQQFVLTGTDSAGLPVVLGVDTDGNEGWRYTVEGATRATIWPAPYCTGEPVVVWQTAPHTLQLATIGDSGIVSSRSIDVGMPPIHTASDGRVLYAVWADSGGIRGVEIGAQETQPIEIPMPYPDNLAVALSPKGMYAAWQQGRSVYLSEISRHANLPPSPPNIDLGDAAGGKLGIVSGTEPLLWAQQARYDHPEETEWISALARVNRAPLLIEGFVHQVVWWGDTIVVVGSLEMLFFKLT